MTQTYSLARPFPGSYWVVPGRLLAGEYPGSLLLHEASSKIRSLLNLGIDTFIDLTLDDALAPYEPVLRMEANRQEKTYLYLKMGFRDVSVPSRGMMKRILDTIDGALDDGHNVYVHCWGGIGRTGTVIGCYLARHGVSSSAVLSEIARLRGVVPDRQPSPETNQQRWMVTNWQAGQ
jgi:hypothetical protein